MAEREGLIIQNSLQAVLALWASRLWCSMPNAWGLIEPAVLIPRSRSKQKCLRKEAFF